MKYSNDIIYIKNLYLNASKIINDHIFTLLKNSINYIEYENIYNTFSNNKITGHYIINDQYYLFFHRLCCRLSNELYKDITIYYIMSPYHNNDVICSMIIPENNISISNKISPHSCKVSNLYSVINDDKIQYLQQISDDFILKSEKIQQK